MKKPFNLSSWDNNESKAKSREMTAAQAEKFNAIRYRVYCGNRLLDAFNRYSSWPFIWGERGCQIKRNGKMYEVQHVHHKHFARLTQIYVKRA